MNLDLLTTERTAYGFLDWVGKVGGLLDGLTLFFGLFVAFCNYKFYSAFLISSLYRMDSTDHLGAANT